MTANLSQLNLELVEASQVRDGAGEFALVKDAKGARLAVAPTGDAGRAALSGFEGDASSGVLVGPLSPRNAAALRSRFEWLRPRPLGTKTSAGLGDRLGLATPGHVRAVRAVGGAIAPIF
ncbi:MAG TPA: tagaturonate epimerase family protein, partial [Planctomycetota bacterium]|nr:tagaturonate epimerase family protein [Planctomycetota bacterium]